MTAGLMTMRDYLSETSHAVATLLKAVWKEQDAVDRLSAKRESLLGRVQSEYRAVDQIAAGAEDNDDVMLATGRHWQNYFGPDKQQHDMGKEVSALEAQVEVHRFSVSSLAGALLQIAKQGLSMMHQGRPPTGNRYIGSQPLSEVVWESRNQAIHWEEGHLKPNVHTCFQALRADFGQQFANYLHESMAFEIIKVLGWKTEADFERDMLSMDNA